MEDRIPQKNNVDVVGDYKPRPFGFGGAQKGVRPADLDVQDGFADLFAADGIPTGWVMREWNDISRPVKDSMWTVKDGILHSGDHRGTWLMSEKEFSDLILEFEIKLTEVGNSGVALRAPMKGDPAFDGMELQMVDPRYYPPEMKVTPAELTGSLYKAVAPRVQVFRSPRGKASRPPRTARRQPAGARTSSVAASDRTAIGG